jgi:hypothetical protein
VLYVGVLSIAFVLNAAPVCCAGWPKRAAVKCQKFLMVVCVFVSLYNELACRNIMHSLLSLYILRVVCVCVCVRVCARARTFISIKFTVFDAVTVKYCG